MTTTIGQLYEELETNYDPEDMVNVGSKVVELVVARQYGNKYIFYTCRSVDEKWDCIHLSSGTSKVSELLATLKSYLPHHKDKCVGIYVQAKAGFELVANNIKSVKTCTLDFSKTIEDMPQIKQLRVGETWKKFEAELAKLKERTNGSTTLNTSQPSLLQIAQVLLISYEFGQIYCVEDTFYRTFSDVLERYPELTETDEKDLFYESCGIKVCWETDTTLKVLCESRKSPKYVTDDGTFTRDELLKLYTCPETVIDKLFEKDGCVMKCKSPDILSAFKI